MLLKKINDFGPYSPYYMSCDVPWFSTPHGVSNLFELIIRWVKLGNIFSTVAKFKKRKRVTITPKYFIRTHFMHLSQCLASVCIVSFSLSVFYVAGVYLERSGNYFAVPVLNVLWVPLQPVLWSEGFIAVRWRPMGGFELTFFISVLFFFVSLTCSWFHFSLYMFW